MTIYMLNYEDIDILRNINLIQRKDDCAFTIPTDELGLLFNLFDSETEIEYDKKYVEDFTNLGIC